MSIDIEAIKERLRATTPGHWIVFNRCFVMADGNVIVSTQTHPYQLRMDDDLAFIAHAPTDIRALLIEVERLQAEIERLAPLVQAADAWRRAVTEINGVQAAEQALLAAVLVAAKTAS